MKKVEKKAGVAAGREVVKQSYGAPVVCAIVVILALMTVMAAVVATQNMKGGEDNGAKLTQEEDTSEPDYSVLSAIDSQGVLDFLAEKRTGFVYLGRPTCPVCQVFAPILTKVIAAEGVAVYYYDTDAANSNRELKNEVLEAVSVTVVPTFMYIRDGVEVERLGDTGSEGALVEFLGRYR